MDIVHSGIDALGEIAWGTHFCHFYEGQQDLVDTLVPYFKAGIENNEKCLWVTAEPLQTKDARTLLRKAVPNLASHEENGQIEIYDHHDWYRRSGEANADDILTMWVDRQQQALEQGFRGLRVTGDTYWLERDDWNAFAEYEAKVNAAFSKHRIVGLCSYCLSRTASSDVFDVVRNHDFALLRQQGSWELLEASSSAASHSELRRLNDTLKSNLRQARDAAETANRMKTEFLANISHEIRTPLATMVGFADLLKEEMLSPQVRCEFVDTIRRNGESLCRIINNVLDVAKLEADQLVIEEIPFSVNALVYEVIDFFRPAASLKAISLRFERDGGLPAKVVSDPSRIRQILVNLVGNAVKFTESGDVIVKVEYQADQNPLIHFEVEDSGIGIPKAAQTDLFQPFHQLDGSLTRSYGGAGLGLYLSRRLAEALDGQVVLERSAPKSGSAFKVSIPVKHADPIH